MVARLLEKAHPGAEVSLVEVTTSGDRDRTTSVATLTEVGAFVRAVQEAVLEGRAELAVHSCKDLPVDGPPGLVSAFPERGGAWDVLCGHDLDTLPPGGRVGTGSPRRAAQMRRLRPDVEVVDIRGNVDTRVEKLRQGDVDALILAEAGLTRLGLGDEIRHRFTIEQMVPAPGQGAMAVEALEGGLAHAALVAIDHAPTRAAVEAERALLARTSAGCRSALGALALSGDDRIEMAGFVEDEHGPRSGRVRAVTPDEAARRLQAELGL
jgi:hydroxymethylbilane synthase